MNNNEIKAELLAAAEEEYRVFTEKLVPNAKSVLGVRLPPLRALAKRIAKADGINAINELTYDSHEETMLKAMVIGYAKCADDERFAAMREFIPVLDNWCVCDTFCTGLRDTKVDRERLFAFIEPYMHSDKEFDVRFAAVIINDCFIDEKYFDRGVALLDTLAHDGYYAKMGVAWALATYAAKCPERTLEYMKKSRIDNFTFNKTIQKSCESYRVTDDMKAALRALKRS